MWGKKSHTPQAVDPEPKNWQTNQPPKPAPASGEGTTKIYKDVMGPAGATTDRATAWLRSSLHVKGEISGNEDLCIDGTVEGLVHLDDGRGRRQNRQHSKSSPTGKGHFPCLIDLQPESLIFLIFLLFHGRALSPSPPSSGVFFRAAEGGRRFANETILFFAVDRIRSQDCSCVL